MGRTRTRATAAIGAALLAAVAVGLALSGLEGTSWAAGVGSFVLAAVAVVLAWPRHVPHPSVPPPTPSAEHVSNQLGNNHGAAAQIGVVQGNVTLATPPNPAPSVPGWVDTALPAGRADARELGTHAARPDTTGDALPPYVDRDVDAGLDRRLEEVASGVRGGLVLVTGPPTAGKTRALAAALARTVPERMLVAPPEDADLRHLPEWLMTRTERAPQGWVVWLDDVDRHLGTSGLTPALVAQLGQVGAIVATTIRQEQLASLRPTTTGDGPQGVGYEVLKSHPVSIQRRWSAEERDRALRSGDTRLIEAAGQGVFGVAEYLAAGPLLQHAWDSGRDNGHPRGYALVAAATDLARAGVSSPLTREQIERAHTVYLPTPPPLPESPDLAWEWATRVRSGVAGLLVPTDRSGNRWRAFDYLTAQGPVPGPIWRTAMELATGGDGLASGITAYSAGQHRIAEAAWHPLAEEGDTDAMSNLGVLLAESGRVEEAERWWRQAAGQGHTNAMHNLGLLLDESGRVEEAQRSYRQAAGQGHTNAMHNLGLLLAESGRVEAAERWWRQAAGQGHTRAMSNLGTLLHQGGHTEEAEKWFRQAAKEGQTCAMSSLGRLLGETGRHEEAEEWLRRSREEW